MYYCGGRHCPSSPLGCPILSENSASVSSRPLVFDTSEDRADLITLVGVKLNDLATLIFVVLAFEQDTQGVRHDFRFG